MTKLVFPYKIRRACTEQTTTPHWAIIVVDESDNNSVKCVNEIEGYGHWRIKYGNSRGKAREIGANTVIEVWD